MNWRVGQATTCRRVVEMGVFALCCGQPYTRGCDCWLQSSSPHYTPQMPPNTTHPTSPLACSRGTGNTCGREVSRNPDVTPYVGRWRSPTCISESTRRSTLYTWDTPRREPKALGREIGAWRRRGWRNTLRGTRARGRAKGFRMQRLRYMGGSGCRIYTLIEDSSVVEGETIGGCVRGRSRVGCVRTRLSSLQSVDRVSDGMASPFRRMALLSWSIYEVFGLSSRLLQQSLPDFLSRKR